MVFQEDDMALRRAALGFLGKILKKSDIPKLQSILSSDQLFESALKMRLRLKDKTATPLLIEFINKDPDQWCRFAPLLPYEPGVFNTLLDNLEKIPPEHGFYMTRSIFYRLPKEQVRQIVIAKEKLLLDAYEAWPALWLSDEDNVLKLVVKAIGQVKPDEIGKIEHFFSSSSMPLPSSVTQKMLDVLIPILGCFSKDSLKWLAMITLRNGFQEWAIKNLDDILRMSDWEHFRWVYPDNMLPVLVEAAKHVSGGLNATMKNSPLFRLESSFQRRSEYDYVANPVDAVKIWSRCNLNSSEFVIAARIVSEFGTCNDIEWWLAQKPKKSNEIWKHTLFHLQRRRWQNA